MPRSLIWGRLRLSPVLRRDALREGELYWVASGPDRGLVFLYTGGHRRDLPSEDAYVRYFEGRRIRPITGALARTIPRGATLPDGDPPPLEEALASSTSTDDIRESLCADLTGAGYEIGAGDRPTRLPPDCVVTYVDRFTFEEAADGSFIGKEPVGFVHVSIFEPIERLASIPDASADFVVACHVLEHVTDVIGALGEIHRVLHPGGRAALVVPDGRYTFDSGRPVTTLEHFVADSLEPGRSDLEHYLEHFRRAAQEPAWIEVAREGHARGRDIHRHVFTPDSMRELLDHLGQQLPFAEAAVYEPAHASELAEFYVRLTR